MPLQYASQVAISYFKCCSPAPFWCVHITSPPPCSPSLPYQFSPLQLLHTGKAEGQHTWILLICMGLHFTEYNWPTPIKLKHNKAPIASLSASSKPKENGRSVLNNFCRLVYLCELGVLSTALAEHCSDCRMRMLKLSRAAFSTAIHQVRV